MVWWKRNPRDLEQLREELAAHHPDLVLKIEDEVVAITGAWRVVADGENEISYFIRIELPDDYPESVPKVWEVGGAIPKTADRHFSVKDFDACLFIPPERWELWPPNATFTKFLEGPVKSFFFSQAFYTLNGRWPFGEWPHGDEGIVAFYRKRFRTQSIFVVEKFLELAKQPRLFRQMRCPCESGERVIRCHGKEIGNLKKAIPLREVEEGLKVVRKQIQRLGRAYSAGFSQI